MMEFVAIDLLKCIRALQAERQRGSLMTQGAAFLSYPHTPDCYEYRGKLDVPIVEPPGPPCPEGNPSHDRVVMAPANDCGECRRRIVLNEAFLGKSELIVTLTSSTVEVTALQLHRQAPPTWIALVERVVGGWASTLRASLLLAILLAGLISLIVVGFGLEGALFVASAGALIKAQRWLVNRSRQV